MTSTKKWRRHLLDLDKGYPCHVAMYRWEREAVAIERRIDELQRAALHTTAEKGKPSPKGGRGADRVWGKGRNIEKEVEIQRRAGLG